MSQHVFKTILNDQEIVVLAGWDRPLQGFFMVIERVDHREGDEEPYLFNNLDIRESHPKSFDRFRNVLSEFGIAVPEEMLNEILRDGAVNMGNKRVLHEIRDGRHSRNVLYEEAS